MLLLVMMVMMVFRAHLQELEWHPGLCRSASVWLRLTRYSSSSCVDCAQPQARSVTSLSHSAVCLCCLLASCFWTCQAAGSPPQQVTWDAASNTLTVGTPGGNPRVLTSTRFNPSFSKDSKPTEIKEIMPVAETDDVKLQWGKAPEVMESAKSAAAQPQLWLSSAGAAAAFALAVLLL